MQKPSRPISSSQTGPHQGLAALLRRHQSRPFAKAAADHTAEVFLRLTELLGARPQRLILDAGCGTGQSTRRLSERFPDHTVLGIDKSAHRLGLSKSGTGIVSKGNYILARADLVDFWRLAATAGWQLAYHYLLYPNPWPKPGQLQRRWHGHAVFKSMLELRGTIELRSNWEIYVQEFAQALEILTDISPGVELLSTAEFLSPFERKYASSGHRLYRLTADLSGARGV